MEDILAKKPHDIGWHSPSWYAALSLAERVPSLQASAIPSAAPQQKDARRFHAWKSQKPFDQGSFFTDRLASDSLGEEELLALLAEPLSDLQSRSLRTTDIPGWLVALEEAFDCFDDTFDDFDVSFQELITRQPLALYLQPLAPLMKRGLHRLYEGIQELRNRSASLPFAPQQCVQSLFPLLLERLLAQVSKTFVLEMHVARIQQQLQGETSQERFTDFVRQLTQEGKILALLEEYPVLARQCVITIDQWSHFALEMLTHLCTDWQDICTAFTPEHTPGPLVEIQGGVGDTHRQGRSVLILTFRSGFQLLYKPKSLAIDLHFQELLAWLNEQGTQPAFRTITILDRGSYGWSEYVYACGCTSRDEIVRFYERQGSYLALLYALNATDIHVENVIASGEHPILVDLEALFHPYVSGNDPTQPYYPGLLAIDQSVFRVGLLPHRIWSNQTASGVDLSGFGGQAGQMSPNPLPHWEDAGTDQMRLTRQHIEIPVRQNRPQLNGVDVNILDYSQHILAGFTHIYTLLQMQRQKLITEILPRFAHDEVRLLLRPSQRYATLLSESFHPDLLRDALLRDRFFDRLWCEIELRPYLARVAPAERRDLLRGDIPMFTTHPNHCIIFTSDGEALYDFFDESGLQLVEQRLHRLDEQDLARQRWIIEAALSTLLIGPEQISGRALRTSATPLPATHERLIACARMVGDRLGALVARNTHGASWLGVSVVNESAWSLLPTDIDLYSGTSGIALFLGYLATLTGETRYTTLAKLALTSVYGHIEQQKKYLKWANIGAFDGLGSALYLLTHLSVLWSEPALLQDASALVELLAPLIEKDERLDIIGGAAGCILNLLSLYSVHPSAHILATARQSGDHLLATAQTMAEGVAWTTVKHEKPLGGFAHGTAGIALSLLKLAEATGDGRYRQTAEAALVYDRSLFLPEQHNWADLRNTAPISSQSTEQNPQKKRSSMVAWCHGAAGVGLSRLGMLTSLDNAVIRKEIAIALQAIITSGLTDNHSLCHGAMGNIDVLLTATQQLGDHNDYHASLEHLTTQALDSISTGGWVTGVPLGVETPGLMTGLAGIGYELLRLAEPIKAPSVLLLSPPSRHSTDHAGS